MMSQERMNRFVRAVDEMAERFNYADRKNFIRFTIDFVCQNQTFPDPIKTVQERRYKLSPSGTQKANESWAQKMHIRLVNMCMNFE